MSQDQQPGTALPEHLGIHDVSEACADPGISVSNGEGEPVYGGLVEAWKSLEVSERQRARPYLAGIIMAVWAISIIASAFSVTATGNIWLALPPSLVSVPLNTILKFYFKES